jgi:hypothetical protein
MRQLESDAGRVVLVADGHTSRRQVLADAAEFLTAELGWDEIRVEDALVDRHGLIARAWILADGETFGQEHHDGAMPVSVVHVDTGEPAPIDAAHAAADRARMAALAGQTGEPA